ncbi:MULTISPECIES: heavy metal translocating P-type ATPase [unclassified Haloferax]|uniref:heavy metal translocating P-type ATPase n=1 Tax=unclassified Haloferax TaxID=2625095 RepID=UPI000E221283|nr:MULTISPECIES: heavy metal translocating P-type ATPase [unclassified Haloferax]MDS0243899.1 cadmium-translocating P-type ATPase [Haloferax sp. S2CR25]MDS0447020.1 cadmium-translocating P-type ATPase [Haloferax sp. S2CR25-2]RDZ39599.1 cadmium-translocating P-type ATPase [Haloferax sp. Atlit-16N]RDZ53766.1 cadmium-translocating P-type ATPase [Haloferax sp. Atlit-10N]
MTSPDEESHDGSGEPPDHTHDHEADSHDHGHTHDHNHDDHEHVQHTGQKEGDVVPSIDQGDVAQFSVPEMDCPSCAGKVENSVEKLDGIDSVDPQVTTGTLSVSYDGGKTTPDTIAERVEKAGYTVEDQGKRTAAFSVPEMDCPSCAGKIENALDALADISSYDTQPTTGKVLVTYDGTSLSPSDIVSAIEGAGYDVTDSTATETGAESDSTDDRESIWTSSRAIKTWISGGFVALGLLFEFFVTSQNILVAEIVGRELLIADVLFLVAVGTAGQVIFRNGYYSALNRNLDIDLLMSIAISGAIIASLVFGESLYFEAATLAFLFSIAELLERYSMDRARNSLRELMDLSPDEATVKRDGEEVTVPVDDVDTGDIVVVRPGEKIPMDGDVLDGESAVNQAPITGESVPVDKTPGDEVYAGTINEQGYLEVEVTSEAGDNTLSRIVQMVEDAQANKTEREQFVERFSSYYTPVVVGFAILVAVIPPLLFGASWPTFIVYGLTLLVLACPCAFVISTPVSVVSGITSAAKNGVLIKGGNHLEAMGAVEAIAMDKTGTITKGELTVTDIVPLNGNSEGDVLRCARGLESRSEHPIGEAIVEFAEESDIGTPTVDDFESITGKGVEADLDGDKHYAGKPGLFKELGFDLAHVHATTDGGVVTTKSRQMCERNGCLDLLEETVPELQSQGKTVVLVGTEDELEGVIAVADEIRPAAKQSIQRLHDLGVEHIIMLTGDNERTARAIADEVGVDEFRAELLPDQKVEAIKKLDEQYDGVAMIGDGVNDAPALATATVGVAMGAAGTDTALETADIALMSDDLSKLPYLYELSHDANSVIRQNIWTSLGAKGLLAVGVPFGLVPIWAAVLVGDAGMTLGVTGNAMRLSRITPGTDTETNALEG